MKNLFSNLETSNLFFARFLAKIEDDSRERTSSENFEEENQNKEAFPDHERSHKDLLEKEQKAKNAIETERTNKLVQSRKNDKVLCQQQAQNFITLKKDIAFDVRANIPENLERKLGEWDEVFSAESEKFLQNREAYSSLQRHGYQILEKVSPFFAGFSERINTFKNISASHFQKYEKNFPENPTRELFEAKQESQQKVQKSFEAFQKSWADCQQEIFNIFEEIEIVFNEVLSPKTAKLFFQEYFSEAKKTIMDFSVSFSEFCIIATSKNLLFQGDEIFWESIPASISNINKYLDFESGILADFSKDSEDRFNAIPESFEFLRKNEFLQDETEVFRKNVIGNAIKIKKSHTRYEKNIKKLHSILSENMEKMSDSEFIENFNFTKSEASTYLQQHQGQVEDFQEILQEAQDSNFFDTWISKYQKGDTKEKAVALLEMNSWGKYENGANQMDEYSDEFETSLAESNKKEVAYGQVYFVSLYDIYKVFEEYTESYKRLRDRKYSRTQTQLGMNIFGQGTQVGKDFLRKDESNEHDRIDEYETEKSSKSGWDILQELYETNDPDEAKCCIEMLIKKGQLRFDDPRLWILINRIEGSNRFNIDFKNPKNSPDLQLTDKEIDDKLQVAVTNIWGTGIFTGWQKRLKGDAHSAQQDFAEEYGKLETTDPGARARLLAQSLMNWKSGVGRPVNSARYEYYLRAAFEGGKQNGGPVYDNRWWFLIHGVAEGILSRKALARFNDEFLASQPLMEFFTDGESWKKDGKVVPKGTPGSHDGSWTFHDIQSWSKFLTTNNGTFMPGEAGADDPSSALAAERRRRFFFENITSSVPATSRVDRMAGKGQASKWDHDDGASYSSVLTERAMKEMLHHKTSISFDFFRNYLSGFDPYMRDTYEQINRFDEEFKDVPGWKQMRDEKLKTLGKRLRVGYGTYQTLSGNYNFISDRPGRNKIFSAEDWEKDSGFSVNADKTGGQILKFMDIVMDDGSFSENVSEPYRKFSREKLYLRPNMDYSAGPALPPDWHAIQNANQEIILGNQGTQVFSDPNKIYEWLKKYCND